MGLQGREGLIRVVQAIPDPEKNGHLNPYNALLASNLPSSFKVGYLDWPLTLFLPMDLVHFHWPETLVRHRTVPGTIVKRTFALALLFRIVLQRIPVVQTVHNLQPHEPGGAFEAWYLRRLAKMTGYWIRLNSSTPTPDADHTETILHGHYREWYPQTDEIARPGSLLYFGLIRPYKGINGLVETVRGLSPNSAIDSLRVVGKADVPDQVELLATAKESSRITFRFDFLPDADLAREIGRAEAIILPYEMHNSGAALLSLSLGRPLILVRNDVTLQLQQEFSDDWIALVDPGFDAKTLDDAFASLRARVRDHGGPSMDRRDWVMLGRQLADVYIRAIS